MGVSQVLLLALVFSVCCILATHCHGNGGTTVLGGELESDILKPLAPAVGHKCIHDSLEKKWGPRVRAVVDTNTDARRRGLMLNIKRAEDWQPFRIYVVWDNLESDPGTCYSAGATVNVDGSSYSCQSGDILTTENKDYLQFAMINVAVERFTELLRVDRSLQLGNLTVNNSPNSGCTGSPSAVVRMPQHILDNGVDADFVFLVTARPIPPEPGSTLRTLAYATACQDATNGRPIVGWANFDPSSLTPNDDDSLGLQVGVAIHEMTHSLGFTGGSFISKNMMTNYGGRYKLTHPLVRDFLRNHFKCDQLDGGLFEDNGGGGTAGSHWEKSAFMNEYMTGTSSRNPVVTAATLLALQATGWYMANLPASESLIFGAGAGCGMSNDWTGCSQWPESYRCSASGSLGIGNKCTADRAGYGPCVTEGAGGVIGDGCSYYDARTTCIFPFPPNSAKALARGSNSKFASAGESFAADSRCFDSTLNRVGSLSDIVPVPAPKTPRCYRVHCTGPTEPRLSVNYLWHPYRAGGEKIEVASFGGSIECPEGLESLMCQFKPVDNDWPRLTSIDQTKAKPSSPITVGYTGASNETDLKLIIETTCDSPSAGNGSLTANLAGSDFWGSPRYLNLFKTKLNVAIQDSQNRSDVMCDAFQADIGFGLAYLKALGKWMKDHPLYASLICIAIAIPILIAIFCCYKCCCKKKKKRPNTRTQYNDSYANNYDAYYYDEELDDRTRHAPPRSVHG